MRTGGEEGAKSGVLSRRLAPQALPGVSVHLRQGAGLPHSKSPGRYRPQVLWLPESSVQAAGESSGRHLRGRRETDAVHCSF